MDRLGSMECFVAVVEAGSFVGAADNLHVSKAAVSRAIIELEARLGARLLQRTTRRLSITEAGRAYYDRCKQILAEVEEADSAVGEVTGHPVGKLRINAPFSFGILHLAPLWGPFMSRYPDVEIEVDLSDQQIDVVNEGYDVVVRISRMRDSTLVYRKLATTRIVACATPDYLASHGWPANVEALADHAVIGYSYAADGDTWHFVTADGPREVITRPRMRANNGDVLASAAVAGLGVVTSPTFIVSDLIATGKLQTILDDFRRPAIGIYAVYPPGRLLPRRLRVFTDFLAESFGDLPYWDQALGISGQP